MAPSGRRLRQRIGGLVACTVAATITLNGLALPSSVTAAEDASLKITGANTESFPQVELRVRLKGSATLGDLTTSSFTVREDGEKRTVTGVETAVTGDLEVIVVFDRSGSMAGEPITAARAAVANFVDRLPAGVLVGLVSFASQATLDVAPTLDREAVRRGIDAIRADGRTALYDGVFLGSDQFSGTKARRLMVVLSDGGDNASIASLDDADRSVDGLAVEVVELATPESNRAALDRLVAPGPVRSVSSPEDLDSVYNAVVDQLLRQVIVTYTSQAEDDAVAQVNLRLVGSTAPDTGWATRYVAMPGADQTQNTGSGDAPPMTLPIRDVSAEGSTNVLLGSLLVVAGIIGVLIGLLVVRQRRTKHRLPPPVRVSWNTPEPIRPVWFRWLDGPRGQQISTALRNAGVTTPAEQFVMMIAAVTLGSFVLLALIAGPLAIIALAVPWVARSVLRSRAKARRDKFISQLPDTLQILATMLRSGYGLVQAIDAVARESDDPTNIWFDRVLLDVRTGRDLGEALKALSVEVQSLDFDWVVVAVEINRDVGGEMARTLESVAETVRERDKLRGQVQALTAEGRMSAYLMLSLPPLTALATIVLNKDYGKVLFEPAGLALVAMSGLLMVLGWAWINRLIDKVAK
jgi:tight adherence protein B